MEEGRREGGKEGVREGGQDRGKLDRNRERESEEGREGNGRFREGKSQWEGAEIERVGGLGKDEKEGKKRRW